MIPVHIILHYLFKVHFNIIPSFMRKSPKWSFFFWQLNYIDNIIVDLRVGCEDVDWMHLWDRDKWQAVVNTLMNL
jgi:hypothetical protein